MWGVARGKTRAGDEHRGSLCCHRPPPLTAPPTADDLQRLELVPVRREGDADMNFRSLPGSVTNVDGGLRRLALRCIAAAVGACSGQGAAFRRDLDACAAPAGATLTAALAAASGRCRRPLLLRAQPRRDCDGPQDQAARAV